MGLSEDIQSDKFESNRVKAMVNLLYTSNWLRDLHKGFMKNYNLQQQHYNVMRIINGKYPEPVSPGHIKQVMLDKGPDVTRLVDKLVKLGYVTRCQNESNRRVMEIKMSQEGRKVLKEMTGQLKSIMDKKFKLTEEDSILLSDLLDKARG